MDDPEADARGTRMDGSADLTRSVSSRRAYLAHEIFPRGADNDDLYTFARFDFAVLALHWRF